MILSFKVSLNNLSWLIIIIIIVVYATLASDRE